MIFRLINTIAFVFMVTMNTLANTLPLNGITTGEVSDRILVLFTPAGYVFSIWGVIYILLGIWIVRQWFSNDLEKKMSEKVWLWFFVSSVFNSVWIVCWHYGYFTWTVVLIVGMLLALIKIHRTYLAERQLQLTRAAFSVYLGWVSVATIANVSYLLVELNWGQFGIAAEAWTVVLLVIATVLGYRYIKKFQDAFFGVVLVWAFIGIAVNRYQEYLIIGVVASLLAAFLIAEIYVQRKLSINKECTR